MVSLCPCDRSFLSSINIVCKNANKNAKVTVALIFGGVSTDHIQVKRD